MQLKGLKLILFLCHALDKFYSQSESYRNETIAPSSPKLIVEALHSSSWHGLTNLNDTVIGIDTFGESAPASELMQKFGFTEENVLLEAKKLIQK